MTKKRMPSSQSKRKPSNRMPIEEELHLMDELYWRAVQDGFLYSIA